MWICAQIFQFRYSDVPVCIQHECSIFSEPEPEIYDRMDRWWKIMTSREEKQFVKISRYIARCKSNRNPLELSSASPWASMRFSAGDIPHSSPCPKSPSCLLSPGALPLLPETCVSVRAWALHLYNRPLYPHLVMKMDPYISFTLSDIHRHFLFSKGIKEQILFASLLKEKGTLFPRVKSTSYSFASKSSGCLRSCKFSWVWRGSLLSTHTWAVKQ